MKAEAQLRQACWAEYGVGGGGWTPKAAVSPPAHLTRSVTFANLQDHWGSPPTISSYVKWRLYPLEKVV